MKKELNYQAFIDKFLNGELEGEELQWFRGEMEVNPRLSEEVRLQQEGSEAIIDEDVMALRDQMNRLFDGDRQTLKKKPETVYGSGMVKLAAASLVAVLIAIGSAVYFYSGEPETGDLFSMHYETYDGVMNVRSGNADLDALMVNAMLKYENREFESALALFEKVRETDPDNVASMFYGGIAYMETGEFEKALQSLEEVIEHGNNLFVENAEWYKGLCYMRLEKTVEAKEHFIRIRDEEGYYSSQAASVLDEL